jgi:hypothetical protein
MNPALIHDIAGHGLAHVLHSHVRKSSRKKVMSRRMARKMSNRKKRWFVDNIIMHHKRLHDRNRELVVSNARTRALARKKDRDQKPQITQSTQLIHQRNNDLKWQQRVQTKDRGAEIRDRLNARKLRANSRWASIIRNDREANGSYSAS